MTRLLNHPQVKPLLSDEHLSVDGTSIEAWLHRRAFGPGTAAATMMTSPTSRPEAQKRHPCDYQRPGRQALSQGGRTGGQALLYGPRHLENRHGLAVAGRSRMPMARRRRASEAMLKARRKAAGRRITAGEDKAYDTADHVANLRAIGVTPHVTQNQAVTKTGKTRTSAIDERTTRQPGYGMSQSRRRWSSAYSDGQAAWHHAHDQIVASLASPPTSCSI